MVPGETGAEESSHARVTARCTGDGQALLEQSERDGDGVHATLATTLSNEWTAGELPDRLHAGRQGPLQGFPNKTGGS